MSCVSASFCTAVGWYGNNNGLIIGFAEVWNGVGWSFKPLPSTSAIRPSSLARVSCTLPTACTAIGYSVDLLQKDIALAERWNGTRWAMQKTAHFNGSRGTRLLDVSCASDSSCFAVGSFRDRNNVVRPLSEGWNGTSWAVHSPLIPAGARNTSLLGVSCPAVGDCIAVGSYLSSTGTEQTLVEDWNGSAWTIDSAVVPPGAQASRLSAVSCASVTACTAVGTYRTGAGSWTALAEQWNGTKWLWRVVPLGGGEQSSELTAVSCSAPAFCTATGSFVDAGGETLALAERRSGPSWALRSIPSPAGAQLSRLDDVSCPTGISCTAVGTFRNESGSDVALATRWDGTSWALQSTPELCGSQPASWWACPAFQRQVLGGWVLVAKRRRLPHAGGALPGRALRLTSMPIDHLAPSVPGPPEGRAYRRIRFDERTPVPAVDGVRRDSGAKLRRTARREPPLGAIAQLGERLDRTQEVGGSSPPSSITNRLRRLTAGKAVGGARRSFAAFPASESVVIADSQAGRREDR